MKTGEEAGEREGERERAEGDEGEPLPTDHAYSVCTPAI